MSESPAFAPILRPSIVDTVVDRLATQILSHAFPPGTRLPAERELADQLHVNRLTLRAALARLESKGLIETQHGSGTVVRDYTRHAGIEILPDLIHVTRTHDPERYRAHVRDVLDLRRTLAAEGVALAAERHNEKDLAAVERAAASQQARVGDVLAFARGDLEFARRVVHAAHTISLELLLNTLVRFPLEDPAIARAMYPAPAIQNEHYGVVIGLIRGRDPAVARDAMRKALDEIDRVTLERVRFETVSPSRTRARKGGRR